MSKFLECLKEATQGDDKWKATDTMEKYIRSLFSSDEEFNGVMEEIYELGRVIFCKKNGLDPDDPDAFYGGDTIHLSVWYDRDDDEVPEPGDIRFQVGVTA